MEVCAFHEADGVRCTAHGRRVGRGSRSVEFSGSLPKAARNSADYPCVGLDERQRQR
jgi:hypothetical protein